MSRAEERWRYGPVKGDPEVQSDHDLGIARRAFIEGYETAEAEYRGLIEAADALAEKAHLFFQASAESAQDAAYDLNCAITPYLSLRSQGGEK